MTSMTSMIKPKVGYKVEPDEATGMYKCTMTVNLPELTAIRYKYTSAMSYDEKVRAALRKEICELVEEIIKHIRPGG